LGKRINEGRFIARKVDFNNVEGLLNFDFSLFSGRERNGTSAMLRVKNEEAKIEYCLRSILTAFDEIVVVDNESKDKTLDIVRKIKEETDREDKIKIFSYPFKIARCGSEHWNTPENSVHSLVYYYNWALSQCSHRYVCKWDGDMVLREEALESFKIFLQRIQSQTTKCWIVPGQTLYRDLAGNYYLAKGEINGEVRVFPYGFNPRYHKAEHWEVLKGERPLDIDRVDAIVFYELKFADEEEFSHWTTTDFPTPRKRREWENFQLIKEGKVTDSRFEELPACLLNAQLPCITNSRAT